MTTTTDISPEKRLTIVKHLASGKDLDVTAALTHLTRKEVLDVASHHGYPSTELLTRAAGLLENKIERDTTPTEHPDAARIAADQARRASQPTPSPTASRVGRALTTGSPEPLTRPDEIRVLINTAKGHPSKRIQAAGDRVIDAVDRLKTLIREDEAKHAEKRRQEATRVAARAEVDRLEAQLREAKARLRGGNTSNKKLETTSSSEGDHACRHDDCDRTFASSQARAMHQRRAHEGFDPHQATS